MGAAEAFAKPWSGWTRSVRIEATRYDSHTSVGGRRAGPGVDRAAARHRWFVGPRGSDTASRRHARCDARPKRRPPAPPSPRSRAAQDKKLKLPVLQDVVAAVPHRLVKIERGVHRGVSRGLFDDVLREVEELVDDELVLLEVAGRGHSDGVPEVVGDALGDVSREGIVVRGRRREGLALGSAEGVSELLADRELAREVRDVLDALEELGDGEQPGAAGLVQEAVQGARTEPRAPARLPGLGAPAPRLGLGEPPRLVGDVVLLGERDEKPAGGFK